MTLNIQEKLKQKTIRILLEYLIIENEFPQVIVFEKMGIE
jgi:hypothetical protein